MRKVPAKSPPNCRGETVEEKQGFHSQACYRSSYTTYSICYFLALSVVLAFWNDSRYLRLECKRRKLEYSPGCTGAQGSTAKPLSKSFSI
jgi:hypothetical protein